MYYFYHPEFTIFPKIYRIFKISSNSNNEQSKIIDLTEEIKKKCTESIIKQYENNSIEIKFPPEFAPEAENIFKALEKSLKETRQILHPLPIENIRFYLLQIEEIPSSYKIIDKIEEKPFFLFLWVFKNKDEISLSCNKTDILCESIYENIPHELTHGAIENLLHPKNTRWFEEGLGNYVGQEVSNKYRPSVMQEKFKQVIPKVSLHRQDIQKGLFSWEHLLSENNRFSKNEWFRYIAAGYLIKLLTENAKREGRKKPLEILFTELINIRKVTGKAANSNQLLSVIEQSLNTNVKNLGGLDKSTQNLLVEDALRELENKNINTEVKNYALIILASIGDLQLSKHWLNFLLSELYLKNNSEYTKNLISTALFIRFGQTDFNEVLINFLQKSRISKKSKKVMQEIEKLSLRL